MTERKCKSLMTTVTQNMKHRQSLMYYAQKHGVVKASRKYNRPRSFIYFWLTRYDGTIELLADRSKRPHSHPNQHTEAELKLMRDMRRRNPKLGLIDLWCRLRERGYFRAFQAGHKSAFQHQAASVLTAASDRDRPYSCYKRYLFSGWQFYRG